MGKMIVLVLMLMLSAGFASADLANANINANAAADAGILPDSPFYGIKIIFENVGESFIPSLKVIHAKKRIAEIEALIQKGKIAKANEIKAKFDEKYAKFTDKQKQDIDDDKKVADNLGQKISAIASQGNMTEQDRTDIKTLIDAHKVAQQQRGRNG